MYEYFYFLAEYKYKYIQVDKNGQILIQTYLVWEEGQILIWIFWFKKKANANTNTVGTESIESTESMENTENTVSTGLKKDYG